MNNSNSENMNNSVEALTKENAALREELEALRHKSSIQQDFISRMSHDIRSPLNAIIGFATLIKNHSFNAQKVHDQAGKILKSSDYMLGIIEDVLNISKIESGSIVLKNDVFDLDQCIQDINEIIIAQVHQKNQKFSISLDQLQNRSVCCDENYLKQILLNLLSNSCKYTSEGGDINLMVRDRESDRCGYVDVFFEVSDNGRGMSEEFQKTLFTPFGREQQSGIPDPGGTGLGLALIKNMIEMMGGTISFESELGVGTTFIVMIPMMLTGEVSCGLDERPVVPEVSSFKGILKGLNILAAEDNDLNRELLSEIILDQGAKIETVPDGRAAVDKYTSSPDNTYDLILMDIMMPQLNGYEATRLIRGSSKKDANSIPIIAMTGNAFEEDVQKALEAGMNAHVSKPFNIDAIEKVVATNLRKNDPN